MTLIRILHHRVTLAWQSQTTSKVSSKAESTIDKLATYPVGRKAPTTHVFTPSEDDTSRRRGREVVVDDPGELVVGKDP